jgi:hypothetical protein
MSDWREHDNRGVPLGLTPKTRVECEMSDGDYAHGAVEEFDWYHENDPVRRYRIASWQPAEMLH